MYALFTLACVVVLIVVERVFHAVFSLLRDRSMRPTKMLATMGVVGTFAQNMVSFFLFYVGTSIRETYILIRLCITCLCRPYLLFISCRVQT